MSVLPSTADVVSPPRHVRFVHTNRHSDSTRTSQRIEIYSVVNPESQGPCESSSLLETCKGRPRLAGLGWPSTGSSYEAAGVHCGNCGAARFATQKTVPRTTRALNTRSTWRFNALITPIRANMIGPPDVATRIKLPLPPAI